MSRISHKTPMAGFDHIRKLLDNAGGKDGVISRADADKLVSDLRSEGRGTEALAAKNLFKMIDARDHKEGNRVTGYDLDKSRSFVEERMLKNRDANSNGFSQAEVAKMSPTARALIELGQSLSVEGAKGRIGHAVPEAGLNHVANLLKEAMGKDGRMSADDFSNLSNKLYSEGRGTEGLAAMTFGSFIQHRDGKENVVTTKDIDAAVGYAQKELLKDYDVNNNGYSKSEVANMSKSGKAFTLLGQLIEGGVIG